MDDDATRLSSMSEADALIHLIIASVPKLLAQNVALRAEVERLRGLLADTREVAADLAETSDALHRSQSEVERLREALKDIADDYEDRFDMDSPSTNPGIKHVVRQARAALARKETT